jgi:hypothetical protein
MMHFMGCSQFMVLLSRFMVLNEAECSQIWSDQPPFAECSATIVLRKNTGWGYVAQERQSGALESEACVLVLHLMV